VHTTRHKANLSRSPTDIDWTELLKLSRRK
jgi:hypothetical protein